MRRTRRAITVLLAIIMVVGLATPAMANTSAVEPTWGVGQSQIRDVEVGAWYYDAVEFVFGRGIMQGVGDYRFDPRGNFTRAASTATLFRIHNERNANASDSRQNNFNDVGNTWYTPYVTWASNNGIVNGTSPTTFAPNQNITRQEIVTLLFRFAQFRGYNTDVPSGQLNRFTDRGQIATWANTAMNWAVYTGVMSGRPNNIIAPTDNLTRAEAAQLLMNFLRTDFGNVDPQPQRVDIRDLIGMTYNEVVARYGHLFGTFCIDDRMGSSGVLFRDVGLALYFDVWVPHPLQPGQGGDPNWTTNGRVIEALVVSEVWRTTFDDEGPFAVVLPNILHLNGVFINTPVATAYQILGGWTVGTGGHIGPEQADDGSLTGRLAFIAYQAPQN